MRAANAAALLLALSLPPSATALAQGAVEAVPFDRKLVASAAPALDRFGATLAVSGDTLVVSAPSATVDNKLFAGSAYVFVRDAVTGAWTERKRLVAQDGAAFDQLGGSAVAVDGDTVLLGVSRAKVGDVLQQGAVYVFERNAGGPDNWGQTSKLTDDSVGSIGSFGSSIAVEGSLMAVGASRGGGNGQVTIFERDRGGPGAWGKVTAILDSAVGDGGTPLESFGGAVALDGDLLLVGAGSADVSFFGEDDGAAYVFRRNGTDRDKWDFVIRLTAPEATLCTGGRTLADVSLDTLENRQAVERCALTEGRTDHDAFGARVGLDGDTIVIAAPGAEAASGPVVGAVYVYRRDAAGADRWDQVAKLTGGDILASVSPLFGSALAFSGRTVLVGASGVDVGTNTDQGAVYRFERDAGGPDAWGQAAKIVAGDGLPRETFGTALALDGVNGIVGASGYEQGLGAVYLTGPAPPVLPPVPAFPATGELITDGVVVGPQGVLLGAVGSPLDEPLPVWIQEVPPPAEPALTLGTAKGAYFNVGATRTQMPQADSPFGLALPVPPGVDPARLFIAARFSTNHIVDRASASWFPLPGVHNPDTGLFSIALPALFIEGTTVVLVEDPAIASLAPTAAPLDEPPPLEFAVVCLGFVDPSECRADRTRMNRLLREAHDDIVGLGYGPPLLSVVKQETIVTEGGTTFKKVTPIGYNNITAVPPGSADCPAGTLASYETRGPGITICYPGIATSDDRLGAYLRHELFHAFQHGFEAFHTVWKGMSKNVSTDLQDMQWIREGTAEASEESGATMHRNLVDVPPLHPVNRALTATGPLRLAPPADLVAYSAQDFWVYVGKTVSGTELGLGYLTELFRRGLSPEAADEMFRDVHGTSLAQQYWKWVKNQAIEKSNDLDQALHTPCSIVLPQDAPVVGTLTPVGFPSPDGVRLLVGTLPRLTAAVVQFIIVSNVRKTTFTVTPANPDADLRYNVYVNNDAGCAADGRDDIPRTFDSLEKGAVVYVVLANTSHRLGSRVQFAVSVGPTP